MFNMRSVNLFLLSSTQLSEQGIYAISQDQRTCFKMVWDTIQEPYVKTSELSETINAEYVHLSKHAIVNPMRHQKNLQYSLMYDHCIPDMARGLKQPRSLQHLCRHAIRSQLQQLWRLPDGVRQLGLPTLVEGYLNLEND